MATVTNLTNFSLFSHPLKQSIAPRMTITGVEDDVAEAACASGILVLNYEPPEDETATPVRQVRTRGSKKVETTAAPKAETR